jgi:predicted permease
MPVELRVAALVALFALGYLGRRLDWLTPTHAGRLLQVVISIGLPALFLAEISRMPLRPELIALPVSGVLIIVLTLAISLLWCKSRRMAKADEGTVVICAMSLNNGFLFPFAVAAWSQEAFAQLALFDLANPICQGFLVYGLAAWYGGYASHAAAIVMRTLRFPPLWALIAALLLNTSQVELPTWLVTILGFVGRTILLLVIVALGVLFDARLVRDGRVWAAILLRSLVGLVLGFGCVWLFDLEGQTRAVLLLGAAAPIGFSAVVIANRERLNRELAASAASISVLAALGYVPLALWLLRP